MKSADKHTSCLLLLCPLSPMTHQSHVSSCLVFFLRRTNSVNVKGLFFSVVSVLRANPWRFTRKKTYSFPPFATALYVTAWCTHISLLHSCTAERRVPDTRSRNDSRTERRAECNSIGGIGTAVPVLPRMQRRLYTDWASRYKPI